MGLRQNSTNRIGNTMSEEHDNMMPDEASDKGGDILGHLMEIYNLIEWGDKPNEWVRVEMSGDSFTIRGSDEYLPSPGIDNPIPYPHLQ